MAISISFTHAAILCAYLFTNLVSPVFAGFDITRNDNVVMYWGQNSAGGDSTQQPLASYCGSDSNTDVIVLAFVPSFPALGTTVNLASACGGQSCPQVGADIKTCQAAGKIVLLSIGGGDGSYGFSGDSDGQNFAQTVWGAYLGGSGSTRPFIDAVLDGIDLDIEGGGSAGYAAFVTELRSLASGASKQYYVSGAPQCPYPDAELGDALSNASFDMVFVQFYNNYCEPSDGTTNYNFDTWDQWASETSQNKDVKVFLGLPAAQSAAGTGYIAPGSVGSIISQTQGSYKSFGGVMLWDASQAYANGRYDKVVKDALTSGSSTSSAPSSASAPSPSAAPAPSPVVDAAVLPQSSSPAPTFASSSSSSGDCSSQGPWNSTYPYVGGDQCIYNNQLWQAKWWTEGDTPGGSAGVWVSEGSCSSSKREITSEDDKRSSRVYRNVE